MRETVRRQTFYSAWKTALLQTPSPIGVVGADDPRERQHRKHQPDDEPESSSHPRHWLVPGHDSCSRRIVSEHDKTSTSKRGMTQVARLKAGSAPKNLMKMLSAQGVLSAFFPPQEIGCNAIFISWSRKRVPGGVEVGGGFVVGLEPPQRRNGLTT